MPKNRVITPGTGHQIEQQIIDYLRQTPLALGVLVMSFFSGQLWAFIVTAFLRSKTKGNKLIESVWGRVAIGLLWFTAILGPVYLLRFGNYDLEYQHILQVVIPTIVTGMLLQLIVFALFACFGDRQ